MIADRPRGQALAEFALVIPIFLVVLFATIDAGRFVYTANALGNSAREAARVGSVGARPDECRGMGREACIRRVAQDRSWGVGGEITTTVTCERVAISGAISPVSTDSCRTADLLTVRTETPFLVMTPVFGQIIGPVTATGETQVTVNQ